jgi:hypothetical protein
MIDALQEHDVPYGDDWDNAGFNPPISSADSRLPRAFTGGPGGRGDAVAIVVAEVR